MRRVIKSILLVASIFLAVAPVQAAEFRSSESSLNISGDQVYRHLHLAAESVTIDSKVEDDLLIAAGTVLSNGEVTGSLFIAGGTVTVRSHISRHLRVLGGNVTISGQIDGDVFIAGGTVTIDKLAVINGGLFLAGGDVIINGKVVGEIRLAGGNTIINGQVSEVKAYTDRLTVNDGAVIDGNLTYYSANKATISDSAKITGTVSQQKAALTMNNHPWQQFYLLHNFLNLTGTILLAWAIINFSRHKSQDMVSAATSNQISNV